MRVACHAKLMEDSYPLSDSPATRMLAEGLARAKDERGLSIRQIGREMGYKTSVVLSHMATGRVPIPIDRSEELAERLRLDKKSFLQAVIRQRHPEVSWEILWDSRPATGSDSLAHELEAALGAPLKDLNREQRAVMREVAAEHSPRRRWLSVHELHAVEVLRRVFPHVSTDGIDPDELESLRALAGKPRRA